MARFPGTTESDPACHGSGSPHSGPHPRKRAAGANSRTPRLAAISVPGPSAWCFLLALGVRFTRLQLRRGYGAVLQQPQSVRRSRMWIVTKPLFQVIQGLGQPVIAEVLGALLSRACDDAEHPLAMLGRGPAQ